MLSTFMTIFLPSFPAPIMNPIDPIFLVFLFFARLLCIHDGGLTSLFLVSYQKTRPNQSRVRYFLSLFVMERDLYFPLSQCKSNNTQSHMYKNGVRSTPFMTVTLLQYNQSIICNRIEKITRTYELIFIF